jgi:hypothetical protein
LLNRALVGGGERDLLEEGGFVFVDEYAIDEPILVATDPGKQRREVGLVAFRAADHVHCEVEDIVGYCEPLAFEVGLFERSGSAGWPGIVAEGPIGRRWIRSSFSMFFGSLSIYGQINLRTGANCAILLSRGSKSKSWKD